MKKALVLVGLGLLLAVTAAAAPKKPQKGANPSADAGTTDAGGTSASVSCTPQTIGANAPTTTCVADTVTTAGGTMTAGVYDLTRWCDQAKSCSSYAAQRRGTMAIEDIDGKRYMRWTITANGTTKSGNYEVTTASATTVTRKEVCSTATTQTVGYSATSTEIVFASDLGQERWTRQAKITAPSPISPIMN